jgi:hypothetical protein
MEKTSPAVLRTPGAWSNLKGRSDVANDTRSGQISISKLGAELQARFPSGQVKVLVCIVHARALPVVDADDELADGLTPEQESALKRFVAEHQGCTVHSDVVPVGRVLEWVVNTAHDEGIGAQVPQ